MLKAEQQQFVQATNNQLLDIRNTEISYFISFFSNFGTQCALISGFIVNAISQVPGLDSTCNPAWKYIYWILSALALMCAMHVLLCTMFINVFGQGLAIRGPLGSMVRAVDGMVQETNQILIAYVASIFFFAFSTIGVYFIMMEPDAAIICACITGVGIYVWYHFVLRIYNRFKWSRVQETLWHENENVDPAEALRKGKAKSVDAGQSAPSSRENSKHKATLFDKLFGNSDNDNDSGASSKKIIPQVTSKDDFTYGGYISMKVINALHQEKWERRYIYIVKSMIFYYSDRKTFETKPEKTLKRRPTDLEAYTLDMVENNGESNGAYILRLTPIDAEDDRKVIEFQCDTVKETQQWIDAFVTAIKLGNAESQSDDGSSNTDDKKKTSSSKSSTFSVSHGE